MRHSVNIEGDYLIFPEIGKIKLDDLIIHHYTSSGIESSSTASYIWEMFKHYADMKSYGNCGVENCKVCLSEE